LEQEQIQVARVLRVQLHQFLVSLLIAAPSYEQLESQRWMVMALPIRRQVLEQMPSLFRVPVLEKGKLRGPQPPLET